MGGGGPCRRLGSPCPRHSKPGSEEYDLIGRSKQIVFVTEDVPAKFQEWSNRGVQFHHPLHTPEWGGTFTSFEDADGNSFVLVGFDEVSREIEAQRRAIEDKLESERRAGQELEIAKQVQARLFPQALPPLKTLDYTGICLQACQVGGDYYDFVDLARSRLALVVGDIAGKGMAAALLMASLHASLRSQRTFTRGHPQRLLRSVNHFLTRIQQTVLTPPSFLLNITTRHSACATQTVDICLLSSSRAITRLNGSIPHVPYWDFSKNGIVQSMSVSDRLWRHTCTLHGRHNRVIQ